MSEMEEHQTHLIVHMFISDACQHLVHSQCKKRCNWCLAECLCTCHHAGLREASNALPASSPHL